MTDHFHQPNVCLGERILQIYVEVYIITGTSSIQVNLICMIRACVEALSKHSCHTDVRGPACRLAK